MEQRRIALPIITNVSGEGMLQGASYLLDDEKLHFSIFSRPRCYEDTSYENLLFCKMRSYAYFSLWKTSPFYRDMFTVSDTSGCKYRLLSMVVGKKF